MPKPVKEKAAFTIRMEDGGSLTFKAEGSVVGGIVEAFSLLPPDRRQTLLTRLQVKQAQILDREAQRAQQ